MKNHSINNCIINACIIILFLSFLVSCKSCCPVIIKQEYVDFNKDPFAAAGLSGDPGAKSVLLVADNQFNNLYTNPDSLRSKMMDKKVKVSIRPPQLDLFSKDMLQWILDVYGKNKYIIHLGDALNIACLAEWDMFIKTMSGSAQKGWVLVPGNHDSCYYGNLEPNKADKKLWELACSTETTMFRKGAVSDKNIFIKNYLSSLIKQRSTFPGDFNYTEDDLNGYALNSTAKWESPDRNSFLKRIAFRYSAGKQHKSFIVQEINLSLNDQNNVFAILLDTTDYSDWTVEPVLTGAVASISKKQLEIAGEWISDLKKENANAKYVLIGHSPINELYYNHDAQKWISDMADAGDGFLCYISAHTHSGWIKKGTTLKKEKEFYEMNIGSTTDWSDTPKYDAIAARTLSLIDNKVYSERIFINSTGDIDSADNFNYTRNAEKCYSCYKENKYGIYDYTIDTLLLTYIRLFKDLKADTSPGVSNLINEAAELLRSGCLDKPVPSDFDENFFVPGIKDCFERKLVHIRKMEIKDENLRQSNNTYKKSRLLYGACQALRASKAEGK